MNCNMKFEVYLLPSLLGRKQICGGSFMTNSTWSLFSSKAVQPSESVSTISSLIRLLSGEITSKQVFTDHIFCLAKVKVA